MRGGRPWSVSSKLWGSSRCWPGRGRNSKEFLRAISRIRRRTRTTSGGWSMRLQRSRKSWQESLKISHARVISTRRKCSSSSRKLTRKEESPWQINRKYRNLSKSSVPVGSKLSRKYGCYPKSLKEKEGKVWLIRKRRKNYKELLMKKYTSLTNSQEESQRMNVNWRFSRTKLRRKGTRVWPMKRRSGNFRISSRKSQSTFSNTPKSGRKMAMK